LGLSPQTFNDETETPHACRCGSVTSVQSQLTSVKKYLSTLSVVTCISYIFGLPHKKIQKNTNISKDCSKPSFGLKPLQNLQSNHPHSERQVQLCESKLPWSNVQILCSLRSFINFHTPLKLSTLTPSTSSSSSMACVLPVTDISGPLVLKLGSSPRNWTLFGVRYRPCHCRTKPSLSLPLTKAVYTQGLLVSGPSKFAKPREKTEPDSDPFRS